MAGLGGGQEGAKLEPAREETGPRDAAEASRAAQSARKGPAAWWSCLRGTLLRQPGIWGLGSELKVQAHGGRHLAMGHPLSLLGSLVQECLD